MNVINNNEFILKDIPEFNPMSLERKTWWEAQKKTCLNGKWVGGAWMPGNLYFYLNFWYILLNATEGSKHKSMGKPWLRDIEWRISYAWVEARGFSGFENDTKHHCCRDFGPIWDDELNRSVTNNPEFLDNGKKNKYYNRTYIPAQEYLRRIFAVEGGNPMWDNSAKNLMLMGSRGFGKSYFVSGAVIAYEFIFYSNNNIVVGAGDSKYSTDLLKKVKFGLENLPGWIEYGNEFYPAPFSKNTSGSWLSGKTVTHEYDVKIGDSGWVTKGSRSSIKHISFKDNHTAANGTRPSVLILEEIGMFTNLMDSHLSSVETMMDGSYKFGSGFYIGTGGDMEGGTIDAYRMFYDPDPYDILPFDDEWEQTGKIGLFMPAYYGLNQFKDDKGITDIEKATKYLNKERDRKRKSRDKNALNMELQYRPLVPSESFLTNSGNIFDIDELKRQLSYLETNEDANYLGQIGKLEWGDKEVVEWKPDDSLSELVDWPVKATQDNTGAIVIYEHPSKEHIPFGLYIGGIDPYDHDKSNTGSLGSCIIYKRFNTVGETYNMVVAEYTGRPATANEFYENIRKLLTYYNGTALYENEKKGLHQYFQTKYCTHLLSDQPEIIKDIIKNSTVDRGKGIHMTQSIKDYAEILLRDMLSEEYSTGKTNYRKLYCKGLIRELISYNDDGNFDRVIAFMMVALYNLELHKVHVKHKDEMKPRRDSFFERHIFTNSQDL